jgi:hypothetical protein
MALMVMLYHYIAGTHLVCRFGYDYGWLRFDYSLMFWWLGFDDLMTWFDDYDLITKIWGWWRRLRSWWICQRTTRLCQGSTL